MPKQPDASDFEVKVLQGSVKVTLSAHGRKIEVGRAKSDRFDANPEPFSMVPGFCAAIKRVLNGRVSRQFAKPT